MLLSAIFFWEKASNCFHVPFGMITPTLLDAAITGLRPTGILYHANLEPKNPISLLAKSSNDYNFTNFISVHNLECGHVSDQEHVAFLLFGLSTHVFWTKSLKVSIKLLPLATLIHEGTPICLGKMVLAKLYESLSEAVKTLRASQLEGAFSVSGPMWVLQFWLVAISEPTFFEEDGNPFSRLVEYRRSPPASFIPSFRQLFIPG